MPATPSTKPVPHDAARADLAGLGALELPLAPAPRRLDRLWEVTWPKMLAAALLVGVWQAVVWSGWKPEYVLPGPFAVFGRVLTDLGEGSLVTATAITMRRALVGYLAATVIGVAFGIAVARLSVMRDAVGSLITGVQTMPSIAWFPLAILLFQLSERAILFVIVLGAAPAIANGLIQGVDQIPPLLLRAGRVLGARGLASYRHIILPAALPGFVGGMKQGWAFSWRSLMAGELLLIIAQRPSLGVRLQFAREFSDAAGLLATMLNILLIGIVVDSVFFGRMEHLIRRRWGLIEQR